MVKKYGESTLEAVPPDLGNSLMLVLTWLWAGQHERFLTTGCNQFKTAFFGYVAFSPKVETPWTSIPFTVCCRSFTSMKKKGQNDPVKVMIALMNTLSKEMKPLTEDFSGRFFIIKKCPSSCDNRESQMLQILDLYCPGR